MAASRWLRALRRGKTAGWAGRGIAEALERADQTLWHAKEMGRDRTGLRRDGKLPCATDTRG